MKIPVSIIGNLKKKKSKDIKVITSSMWRVSDLIEGGDRLNI